MQEEHRVNQKSEMIVRLTPYPLLLPRLAVICDRLWDPVQLCENDSEVERWPYLPSLGPWGVLKIDVEGFEFTLMRDLIVSGVLCSVVTNLFVEWHPSIDWKREGLPEEEPRLENVYKWLLRFKINRTGYEHVPLATRHCRTTLMRWV